MPLGPECSQPTAAAARKAQGVTVSQKCKALDQLWPVRESLLSVINRVSAYVSVTNASQAPTATPLEEAALKCKVSRRAARSAKQGSRMQQGRGVACRAGSGGGSDSVERLDV